MCLPLPPRTFACASHYPRTFACASHSPITHVLSFASQFGELYLILHIGNFVSSCTLGISFDLELVSPAAVSAGALPPNHSPFLEINPRLILRVMSCKSVTCALIM